MKFILMTNPTLDHNVVYELIKSNLKPQAIITDNPFYVKKTGFAKYFAKKLLIIVKYLRNRQDFRNKYKPYFLAKEHSIPLYNSVYVNTEDIELKIKKMQIDYIFTFGFRILKENIINAPKKGCINFHPAYLPFNRGATPSKWVILNNQKETGITFHYINKGIDKGAIIEQYKIPLSGNENAEILNKYLFNLGTIFLIKLICKIRNNVKIIAKPNAIDSGSYQPPFGKECRTVSEKHTYKEINDIVMASSDGYNNAIYKHNEKEYKIINSIEIEKKDMKISQFPYIKIPNRIFIKSFDDKIIMLITNKNNK